MDSLELYLFPEGLLYLLLNLYIPPWLGEIFKFMVFRSLENEFVSQKIESIHFYSCLLGKTLP